MRFRVRVRVRASLRAAERPVGHEVPLLIAHVDELLLVLRQPQLALGQHARALLERLLGSGLGFRV